MNPLARIFALVLLLAACATPSPPGYYEGVIPEGRNIERVVRVRLFPDGRATVNTARWGSFSYVAEGAWKEAPNRMVVVELKTEPPQRLVFQHGGDLLVTKEWDKSIWGERGPGTLSRVH